MITCSDWWILDHVGVLFIQGCGGFPTSLPVNMTPSMLRRQLKNLVQNYSEAEVKVGTLPEGIPSSFPPSDRLFLLLLRNAKQTQAEEERDRQQKRDPFHPPDQQLEQLL